MKSQGSHSSKQYIGQLIKLHRVKKGITLQELADLLNTDRQYIWKIENGKINLTLEYLDKILSKLNCSHTDFFKELKD